jgi:hypothetical protein
MSVIPVYCRIEAKPETWADPYAVGHLVSSALVGMHEVAKTREEPLRPFTVAYEDNSLIVMEVAE